MTPYLQKLKDPRWQKKRLEIFERDEFTCQFCQSPDNTLHVHHRLYLKGSDPWDYNADDLVTLCESCHDDVRKLAEQVSYSLDFEPYYMAHKRLMDLMAGGLDIATVLTILSKDRSKIGKIIDEYFHRSTPTQKQAKTKAKAQRSQTLPESPGQS